MKYGVDGLLAPRLAISRDSANGTLLGHRLNLILKTNKQAKLSNSYRRFGFNLPIHNEKPSSRGELTKENAVQQRQERRTGPLLFFRAKSTLKTSCDRAVGQRLVNSWMMPLSLLLSPNKSGDKRQGHIQFTHLA